MKICKNITGAQNMLMYFRGVDALQANFLKRAYVIKNLQTFLYKLFPLISSCFTKVQTIIEKNVGHCILA